MACDIWHVKSLSAKLYLTFGFFRLLAIDVKCFFFTGQIIFFLKRFDIYIYLHEVSIFSAKQPIFL